MFIGLTRAASAVGQSGTFTFFNEFGIKQEIPIPSTVRGASPAVRPAFCTWKRGTVTRTYIFGQFEENLMATEHKAVLRIGIQAPSGAWVNSAVPTENKVGYTASGTGLTGSAVLYRRFYDSLHNRRSPLSGPSPAITLTNQGISIVNAELGPTPSDTGVDTMEIWVSLDGGLPRRWASRDIGVANFLVNETVTGEAETNTESQYPVLKFGVLANDALFAAGDPRNPNVVYVSLSGEPEIFTGITIPTRNGEEVIGLASIGGSTVYVQCANSSYYIQGFDESDLVMKPLEPKIGGLGHHTISQVHDVAFVPTQLGGYICTGTALIPIGFNKWDRTWRDTLVAETVLRSQGLIYSDAFSVTDYSNGIIKYFPAGTQSAGAMPPEIIGFPVVTGSTYWIIDISGLVPETGPGIAPLMFDTRDRFDTCAAMLAAPGSLVGRLYTADRDGYVYLEGVAAGGLDGTTALTSIWHSSHDSLGDIAEEADAFQVNKVWPILQNEFLQVTMGIYVGNDFAWQQPTPYSLTIPAGAEVYLDRSNTPLPHMRVPRSQVIKTPGLHGSCISVRLTCVQDTVQGETYDYDGNQYLITEQRTPFGVYGIGYAWVGGHENRPDNKFDLSA